MNLNKNELKSAIIGMIIGDGSLQRFKNKSGEFSKNVAFQMTHCEKQYEYMLWKKDILENISKCKIHPMQHKAPNGKECSGYHLYGRANPIYTKLYSRFHQYGKKSVDEYLVKMITPLALAIMYMDDGCMGKGYKKYWTKETCYLCLDNFDYANLFLIKKSLKIKFDLDWNINRTSGKYYQLRLLNNNNEKFINLIRPYVEQVPSMMYKLGSYAGYPAFYNEDKIQSDPNGDIGN
uniref:Putative homing endonuclease n=1 Tax=viral metagenome TaxID=1070528 RepID=A0A6M3KD34_9ZZZZ